MNHHDDDDLPDEVATASNPFKTHSFHDKNEFESSFPAVEVGDIIYLDLRGETHNDMIAFSMEGYFSRVFGPKNWHRICKIRE
ncbi:hypothetical protein RMSM_02044 [Rhodopirellula maiorica SM1]|uniref:Uncharacterized protein n=1 Tax=Rhodopirellula maiorica SM1 TaxID=1265738 RepID=M5S045_9BACT|nr:hypothetical protein [Rhodopirellula maiorica]EMI21027.1 hypothetical protein RMSM_02044 [Rhodopirellula maiorica SM1]